MYRISLLYLLLLLALTQSCKKNLNNNPIEPQGDIELQIKSFYSLQNRIALQFKTTFANFNDEMERSDALLEWIRQQPEVNKVEMNDPGYFYVEQKNGLAGHVIFNKESNNARSVTRGGGNGSDGRLKLFKSSGGKKFITNNNVLVVLAHAGDFYKPYSPSFDAKHIQDFIDLFEYADIDFKVTLKVDEGIEAFNKLDNYGIIVFNTHGTELGLSSGEPVFSDRLIAFSDNVQTTAMAQTLASRLQSREVLISSFWEYNSSGDLTIKNVSYELTFDYFRSLPVKLDSSILIGNYCYSGIKNGIMGKVLEPKGLISFYGYAYNNGGSAPITNDMAWRSEDTIVTNLIRKDKTGIAHLQNNKISLEDTLKWKGLAPSIKIRMAEKRFIFGPIQLNHYLDAEYKFFGCGDSLTDERDGQVYPTVCIGKQIWMAKNLNWAGAGTCYAGTNANCNLYGRLYLWDEASGGKSSDLNPSNIQGVCPEGWHLPSNAEWNQLTDYLGGGKVAGGKMKSTSGWDPPNTGATNSSGFSGLPSGYKAQNSSDYVYLGLGCGWWSSTEISAPSAYARALDTKDIYCLPITMTKQRGFSVRCIKD